MTNGDPLIRDQAYQFFQQEAVELLQTIENGLIRIQEDYDTPHIHQLMRAAHSIKGGAASVDLPGIQRIAHRLEDIFRALYQRKDAIDNDLEEALFQAYDCLRLPLIEQFETGSFDAEAAWVKAEPIFQILETILEAELAGAEFELPSAAELGVDLVLEVFTGDIRQGIDRLAKILEHPEGKEVGGEIRATAEVFEGLGELLGLSGFSEISRCTIRALKHQPQQAFAIGIASLESFQAAYDGVLEGDRTQGGQPNATLLSFLPPPEAESINLPEEAPTLAESELEELSMSFSLDQVFTSSMPMDSEEWMDRSDELESTPDLVQEEAIASAFSIDQIFGADLTFIPDEDADGEITDPQIEPELPLEEGLIASKGEPSNDEPSSFAPEPTLSIEPTADIHNSEKRTEAQPEEKKPQATEQLQRNESIRVDFNRLERLNNLVGELITQENGTLLLNRQLQAQIKQLKQRFSQFEQFGQTLQGWMDKSSQSGSHQSTTPLPPQKPSPFDPSTPVEGLNLADMAEFDPLQMDSYSSLYTTVQAAVEEIAQMEEQIGDITLISQSSQRIQRQKQQTLKQVRNDLLWARMLPLNDVLNRFPRMLRDLSSRFDKRVKFKQVGAGTLVDKAVLERLYDPLVHLVRNAFDHGTESPEERLSQGKSAQATIEVRAYHRGNQTFIEVRDDGRGIDPERLRTAVIEKNLVSAEAASKLTRQDLYQFMFEPSFSTATTVSEISGRGMGLSAVQEQIRALKGKIRIESEVGQGTVFIMSLPLTLTIAKLLVFSVDKRQMAIPIDALYGIVNADASSLSSIQGRLFFQDEDDLIPLYPSSCFLHHYPIPLGHSTESLTISLAQSDKTPLLLISGASEVIALEVDQIVTEQELVIKPFGHSVVPPSYLYGCAIMGDGALVPVIDSEVLVANWQNQKEGNIKTQEFSGISPAPQLRSSSSSLPCVLVIDDSLTTRQNVTLTLQKFGYQVIQAGDGREALDQLENNPQIQAVISDVEMPNMNGFEFLSTCRKSYAKDDLPVIMLTSRSGDKHQKIARLLGANDYLTKPYLENQLRDALGRCLEAVPC